MTPNQPESRDPDDTGSGAMVSGGQRPQIRDEMPGDVAGIRRVVELAFRGAAHTCRREHLLVDALREAGALSLSLVAETHTGIVGHLAASPVVVSGGTRPWYGIGPLAVLPAQQRRGIGSLLMETALGRLRSWGARGCVLVGNPAYYVRFGFHSDPALVVPGVPVEVSLSLRFVAGADHGTVAFHKAFAAALGEGDGGANAADSQFRA